MNKKKYFILVALFTVILLIAISSNFKQSTTVSRYRSELNGSSSARVAKWNITSLTKKNGQSVSLDAGFNENVEEGTGNWFFDIENKSEVTARIQDGGIITLRLDSDSLSSYGDQIEWNFINNVDNPVHFQIYVYDASASSLLFYEKNGNVITFDAYNALSETDKKDYAEVFKKEDAITELKLLDTNSPDLRFERKSEIVDSKVNYYYQAEINLTEQLTNQIYELGLNKEKASICFRVLWSVSGVDNDTSSTTTNEKFYYTYKLVEGTSANSNDENYNISGVNYYIERRELPFFDYLKYTSSLGGEPRFEFPTTGGKKLVPYSQLTTEQKKVIEGYKDLKNETGTGSSISSLENLKKYIEYLEYTQYGIFNEDNESFIKELSYLVMGLKMTIHFDLTIVQVD